MQMFHFVTTYELSTFSPTLLDYVDNFQTQVWLPCKSVRDAFQRVTLVNEVAMVTWKKTNF
jgi:hypothetical protein